MGFRSLFGAVSYSQRFAFQRSFRGVVVVFLEVYWVIKGRPWAIPRAFRKVLRLREGGPSFFSVPRKGP